MMTMVFETAQHHTRGAKEVPSVIRELAVQVSQQMTTSKRVIKWCPRDIFGFQT